jgi:tetratricopeptide (TPR) repeat protein
MPPKEAFSLARDAAIQALARDSTLAIAHASLGVAILTVDLNYPAGLAEICHGLQLDSNSVDVLQTASVGTCLIKPDRAGIEVAKRAVVLDPLSPVESWNLAYCYYISRKYAEAIAQDARTKALDPGFFYWSSFTGEAKREMGDYASSVAAFEAAARLAHDPSAGLAGPSARMGRRAEALQIARAIEDTMKHRYLPPEWVAEIFANLGETDSALVWLQHGIDARSSYVALLNSWPVLDPIRHDPRFQAMVKRLGLP